VEEQSNLSIVLLRVRDFVNEFLRVVHEACFIATSLGNRFRSRIFCLSVTNKISRPRLAVFPAGKTSLRLTKTCCAQSSSSMLLCRLLQLLRIVHWAGFVATPFGNSLRALHHEGSTRLAVIADILAEFSGWARSNDVLTFRVV
jgi:hypothetical protein